MDEVRRRLLTGSALLPVALALEASPLARGQTESTGIDAATLSFWTQKVRQPTDNLRLGVAMMGAAEEPAFVYFDQSAKTFTLASDLSDQDLPATGDAKVVVRVERFRPSANDAQQFQSAKTGTLRIDVGQINTMPGLAEALAWTSIAAFVPNASGHIPSLDKLQFDPGQGWSNAQNIPLPNGVGYWTWNFFLKKPEHLWGKIISIFSKAGEVVFPLLGLPGIALSALKDLDKMLGYVQAAESSTWLLQSVDKPVYATKNGKDQGGSDAIRLRTGTYLVMPESHLSIFGKAVSGLEVQNGGYVVPKGTDEFQRIRVAEESIPDVTYLAVSVVCNLTKKT